MSAGAIAGAVVGAVALIAFVAACALSLSLSPRGPPTSQRGCSSRSPLERVKTILWFASAFLFLFATNASSNLRLCS